MALDVLDAGGLGLGDELRVQVGVARDERHVHKRAELLLRRAAEQLRLIQVVVQDGCLLLVHALHNLKAAQALKPLEHLAAHVDAVARRGVRQAAGVGLRLVAHDGGREGQHVLADKVVAHDDDDHAGRADVLLHAAVDQAVLRHVNGLGEEHAGHVGHQRDVAGVGKLRVARAVHRFVLADVDVVGVGGKRQTVNIGHVREVFVLGAGHAVGLAVQLRLLERLLRPVARHDVVGNLVLHEVHRDGRELLRGAALQKQHAVVVGDVHEVADVLLSRFDDALERGGAVRHLHDRHARALVIEHFRSGRGQHLLGEHCRTGREIVHTSHAEPPWVCGQGCGARCALPRCAGLRCAQYDAQTC